MIYLYIGLGGLFGSISRYLLSKFLVEKVSVKYPVGTWVVNITGAFGLSFLSGILTHGGVLGKELGLALTTGFLGAYTTFSAFSYETVTLVQDRELFVAACYMAFSIVFGLAAAFLGLLASGVF